MRSIFSHYLRFVINFPKTVLVIVAILSIAMAVGLPRFKLDASADSLTLEHDKDLSYFRKVTQQYRSGDFLVVTFRPDADLFSDQSIALLGNLRDALADADGIRSINSILDVPLLYSPKQSIAEIMDDPKTLTSPSVDKEQAKEEFLTSPIYRNLILSPDGQTTALQLNFAVDDEYIDLVQRRDDLRLRQSQGGLSPNEERELEQVAAEFRAYRTKAEARSHERVEEVRAVVDRFDDQAEIFVGGLTMITADMIRFIKSDLIVFGAAVVLFMIVILAAIFRSLRFVVIPMVTCLTAVLLMLGLVSWLDWRLTIISSNFVALLLIISLAIIIHLVVRYREYAREHPNWSQQELVSATVTFMARPCLYTALTTIVAFASFVVSDIRPVIDFGWLMTIGLVVALVLAFCLMPACLVLLPPEKKPQDTQQKNSENAKPLTIYFSQIVEKRGGLVLIASAVIAALSAWGVSQLEVENRFIDYFHESTEIYQGLSVIDKKLGGTTSLDIILSKPQQNDVEIEPVQLADDPYASDDSDGYGDPFAEPESTNEDPYGDSDDPFGDGDPFGDEQQDERNYWLTVSGLKRIEKVHDHLDAMPEVGKVQSLAILYKVGKDLNGGLNDFELAVMQKKLSEEVKNVLISPFIPPQDTEKTRITLRIHDTHPGLNRKALVERIHADLLNEFDYAEDDVRITGLLVLYNNMLQSLFSSQIATLGAVFVGIMLMFMVLFRSLIIALVAIVPNILAALSVLGGMGLMGLPLDMMTITVAAITVGIGVDDTIHYIHRFKEELKVDGDYTAAMHRAHGSIGRAMYYTSVIIIFGFGIMVLSNFIPTIYFGLLTGFAMFAALMGALLLLPKLILLTRPFNVTT